MGSVKRKAVAERFDALVNGTPAARRKREPSGPPVDVEARTDWEELSEPLRQALEQISMNEPERHRLGRALERRRLVHDPSYTGVIHWWTCTPRGRRALAYGRKQPTGTPGPERGGRDG